MKWQIYPPVVAASGQEWQFYISTVRAHFLLLEVILADEVADLSPAVVISSGQEC